MPVSYVGTPTTPPTVDRREQTIEKLLAPGTDGNLLTTEETIFRTESDDVLVDTEQELFRFVVNVSESEGTLETVSARFKLVWTTLIENPTGPGGYTYWEIGATAAPVSWVNLTDEFYASDTETVHSVSGAFLPTEAEGIPFTIRLMGYLDAVGPTLTSAVLSTSSLQLTYRVTP